MADPDELKILVATDNHLGFLEKDAVRGDDSFRTFEEILKAAAENDVDFILLGGDLFHDNKPSRRTLYLTFELFRRYCLGSKPCSFNIISDFALNFQNSFAKPNFMDQNYNVAFPAFCIHGNHDDPSGKGNYSAIDLMAITGLLNYFGKVMDHDNIEIQPILMTKGNTKLALYGLGNIRDERLFRAFRQHQVTMSAPQDGEEWFNLFVVHQNRVAHSPKDYLPESYIDPEMDLVIWAHEHECLVKPERNEQLKFFISQPGSSVATALSEGEARPKHIALLRVKGKNFRMEPIRLKTVRPFVIDEIVLKDQMELHPNDQKGIEKALRLKIDELILRARQEWQEANPDMPAGECPLPLVRLRVEYTDFSTFNPQRFGQEFVNKAANPADILVFYRKKQAYSRFDFSSKNAVVDEPEEITERLEQIRMETVVNEYLEAQSLDILPETELGDAITEFVVKDEKDCIEKFIKKSLSKSRTTIKQDDETVDEPTIVSRAREDKKARQKKYLEERGESQKSHKDDDAPEKDGMELEFDKDFSDPNEERPAKLTRTRQTKVGSKTAATKKSLPKSTTASRKGKAKKVLSETDESEVENIDLVSEEEEKDGFEPLQDSDVQIVGDASRKRKASATASKQPAKKVLKQSSVLDAFKTKGAASSSRWPSRSKK